MNSCKDKKKSKAAGILLIAVFSMLQLALLSPSLMHALHKEGTAATATCQNDHVLCGCSPSRIAAETCCCALTALSPCCQKNALEEMQEKSATTRTAMTSLPCGGSEDPLVVASLEVYLLPAGIISACPVSTTVYLFSSVMNQTDHTISPPIPPPKV